MSVQMLVCEPHQLAHGLHIHYDKYIWSRQSIFERRQNVTDIAAHPPRIVRDACKCCSASLIFIKPAMSRVLSGILFF